LQEKVYTAGELDQLLSSKGRQPTQGKTVTQAPQAKVVMKEELQKSATEGLSQKQMEEKRLEILKRLREEEIAKLGGEHSIAGFDHILLRERLKNVTPLQQLYERVFFDDYDLAAACRPYDSFKDSKHHSNDS